MLCLKQAAYVISDILPCAVRMAARNGRGKMGGATRQEGKSLNPCRERSSANLKKRCPCISPNHLGRRWEGWSSSMGGRDRRVPDESLLPLPPPSPPLPGEIPLGGFLLEPLPSRWWCLLGGRLVEKSSRSLERQTDGWRGGEGEREGVMFSSCGRSTYTCT